MKFGEFKAEINALDIPDDTPVWVETCCDLGVVNSIEFESTLFGARPITSLTIRDIGGEAAKTHE